MKRLDLVKRLEQSDAFFFGMVTDTTSSTTRRLGDQNRCHVTREINEILARRIIRSLATSEDE